MNHTTAPPKTDTDPAGTTIYFDEEAHLYWTDKCSTFVSGTTFVKHHFPEFDGPKIAKRKTRAMGTQARHGFPHGNARSPQLRDANPG